MYNVYYAGGGSGGSPHSPKSTVWREGNTRSACWHFSGSVFLSGIMTTCIPAALPAVTPLGASSNTNT